MCGFIYPHNLKIWRKDKNTKKGKTFTGRKGKGIVFTTGVISKDLRPSANILRHHRRWGS